MAHKHLAVYLNDHLAGSAMLMDLLAHLAEAYKGKELEHFATDLRADVAADRQVLESLMGSLQIPQSTVRKTSGWLAEKAALLKLSWDDRAGGDFHLLESAEAISLGIAGKHLLWKALSVAEDPIPELRGPDYEELMRRAEEQRTRVESIRIDVLNAALLT